MSFQVMEVCGTHTHVLMKLGLKKLYSGTLDLISGPGCPVCVTSQSDLDVLFSLCLQGVRLYSFGDLLKVPGHKGTLRELRAQGGDVREIYSPLNVLEDLEENPTENACFVAIGFETTAPLVASLVEEIEKKSVSGLYIYSLLKLIPPAMEVLLSDDTCMIDGFICPGHVSVVIGEKPYESLAQRFDKSFVIAGFEESVLRDALDIIVDMLRTGRKGVENAYSPLVQPDGNPVAQKKIRDYFEVFDADWRGLGHLPNSGLRLKKSLAHIDAEQVFTVERSNSPDLCPCGEVLTGRTRPFECSYFGIDCVPETPIGPCMVSSEGACHAEFLYGHRRD